MKTAEVTSISLLKIENRSGVDHIEEICQVADGVMVPGGTWG